MGSRSFIESALPLKALSEEARREKAIRHGHISTLHVWWARRPLVVARAAVFASLVDADAIDEEGFQKFVARLCQWEVHDGDPVGRYLLEQARTLIRKRFPDRPPRVLDPFAGGGSIPLETLRLGCEAHAVEYNPVAYLILKATVEYPQRYGARLAEDVRRWGEWVLEGARGELAPFYPPGPNRETVVAYIWSRTVRCPNPNCGAEIPLFRQFWLARKDKKKVALFPVPDRKRRQVNFRVLEGAELEEVMRRGFDPSEGTVSRANARCLVCGTGAWDDYIRAEAREGRLGHRLVALVTTRGRGEGRHYHIARPEDEEAFGRAEKRLEELKQTPSPWANGLSWVPEEPMLPAIGNNFTVSGEYIWGIRSWGDLFNPRQLLALVTFGKWVREAIRQIAQETDPEYAKAVGRYLALGVDFLLNNASVLCSWHVTGEKMRSTFAGHHLHMVWDYAEVNPFSETTGNWQAGIDWVSKVVEREGRLNGCGTAWLGSTTDLPQEENSIDAVITDPPYYDNVPYADLSDFFYVWLKRMVGDLYPEAFRWELTPKDEEAVMNPARFGGGKKGEEIAHRHYERLMNEAFREIYRVLKPEGIAVVMFTHRSTTAWESLIKSLLYAGLYPTASWPVHTEMEASTHQRGKGAVRTTILMACRKRPAGAGVGWYHQIRDELHQVVRERLEQFWAMGLRGADFFISSIGPAVGVFGRYEQVLRPDGHEVGAGELLDEVRALASDFALEQLGRGLGRVDPPTRFYVLWRWAYGGADVEFDEANKLAKSLGAELDELADRHRLIRRKGETVILPDFWTRLRDERMARPIQRAVEEGALTDLALIDILHTAVYLWRRGEREELVQLLSASGFQGEDHPFWQVAQALYEVEQVDSSLSEEVKGLGQMLPAAPNLLREARDDSSREKKQLKLFKEKE
jgi:adenine-specific DNA methylase